MLFLPTGKCQGHSSFVTHIDWTTDSNYLRSNSGDYELLYWEIPACKQYIEVSEAVLYSRYSACICTQSSFYISLCDKNTFECHLTFFFNLDA